MTVEDVDKQVADCHYSARWKRKVSGGWTGGKDGLEAESYGFACHGCGQNSLNAAGQQMQSLTQRKIQVKRG